MYQGNVIKALCYTASTFITLDGYRILTQNLFMQGNVEIDRTLHHELNRHKARVSMSLVPCTHTVWSCRALDLAKQRSNKMP